MHRLTKAQARRIAVRAQLLDAPRPTDLLSVVQRLTLLQIDPTAAIAPSADLVAWSRLGSAYEPDHLRQALEEDRTLFERAALVRPIGDLGLHLSGAAAGPTTSARASGFTRTIAFAATSWICWAAQGHSLHATSRTRLSFRGRRPGGPTTATSPRCWSA
jgi:hypothetical protein